jgi:putative inorganic carbon (HCO3(-)) transporter
VFDHPFTGVGWGRFLDRVTVYVWQADLAPLTNVRIEAHNIFLARAAELGMPGLILLLLSVALGPVCVVFARQAKDRVTSEAQVLAVIAACAWFMPAMLSPMSYPLPNAMAWGLAGLAIIRRADGALARDERQVSFRAG